MQQVRTTHDRVALSTRVAYGFGSSSEGVKNIPRRRGARRDRVPEAGRTRHAEILEKIERRMRAPVGGVAGRL